MDVPDSRILVTRSALEARIGQIPPGDAVLDPEELDAIADQVLVALEPPVDLSVIYTTAKL